MRDEPEAPGVHITPYSGDDVAGHLTFRNGVADDRSDDTEGRVRTH